jgi:hypothetical protein
MSGYVLMVYTRPIKGLEADYHRWYDETHLAEVLAVPGFVAARRLEVLNTALAPNDDRDDRDERDGCVAEFTIASDDIDATLAEFDRARASMQVPPCLDPASVRFQLLRPLDAARLV